MADHRCLADSDVFQRPAESRSDVRHLDGWEDLRLVGFLRRHPGPECWDGSPDDSAACYLYYCLDRATCCLAVSWEVMGAWMEGTDVLMAVMAVLLERTDVLMVSDRQRVG